LVIEVQLGPLEVQVWELIIEVGADVKVVECLFDVVEGAM
jgi:hypothetical protein